MDCSSLSTFLAEACSGMGLRGTIEDEKAGNEREQFLKRRERNAAGGKEVSTEDHTVVYCTSS